MRLLISLIVFSATAQARLAGYAFAGPSIAPWEEILTSIGLSEGSLENAAVVITPPNSPASLKWLAQIESGTVLVLVGDSPLARSFGFERVGRIAKLTTLLDSHQPDLPLILQSSLDITESSMPKTAQVFTRERWTHVPVVAGVSRGKGGVLWLASDPGLHGYERFPFLPNALCDLGLEPPFRGNRLWAFFDYAYRARVDVNWFAKQWHESGIAALHVAAWHFFEPDPERDRYLNALIEACHREGVLVYAWLELPHVSERFWADYPAWREKTALLQDAHLDWRKLMNLANPECAAAVDRGVGSMVKRFDWDGLNFAELYYESLEGTSNPARFTPMNDEVRARFAREAGGFDPVALWTTHNNQPSLRKFLDFRANMARELQKEWLSKAEAYRKAKPDLDIVLTHVDDRLDTAMKDAIGADTSTVLPVLQAHNATILIEDPATVWDRGPQRYPIIASKYTELSNKAVDINIVERYQDVYPTKQQTGLELLGLVHLASLSFPRVALYIENALSPLDLSLLSYSASDLHVVPTSSDVSVDSRFGGRIRWRGTANLDGNAWPVSENGFVSIPAGPHTVSSATGFEPRLQMLSLTGELIAARYRDKAIEFSFTGSSRSIARFNVPVGRVLLDGVVVPQLPCTSTLLFPKGKHSVIAWPQADGSGTGCARDPRQTLLSNRRSQ